MNLETALDQCRDGIGARNDLDDHHIVYVFPLKYYLYPDPDIPRIVLVIDDMRGDRQAEVMPVEDVDRHWHRLAKTYWYPGARLSDI